MKNSLVTEVFRNIASLLEIKAENPFRVRAYLRAADQIESLNADIEEYTQEDRLSEIQGIGKDLSEKVKEILRTGTCALYEDLKK